MGRRIALIQGHPDPSARHFGHALADAYAIAARDAGHELRMINVARLHVPLLRSASEWQSGPVHEAVRDAQRAIAWAEHVVIVYPLWLGDMPAVLKGFLEQVLRPGFAIGTQRGLGQKLLKGRSARVVVTMGMPAFFYRLYFGAHSLKSLERNILAFCGVSPVRSTIIGTIEGKKETRVGWLAKIAALGRKAA